MEIRSELSWDFVMVKIEILDSVGILTNNEKLVYICLYRFANIKTSEAYPSIKRIADMAGVSDRTVHKSIKRLIELKLLRVDKRKVAGTDEWDTNLYTFLEIPDSFRGSETISPPKKKEMISPPTETISLPVEKSFHHRSEVISDELYKSNEINKNDKRSDRADQFRSFYHAFWNTFGYDPTPMQLDEINYLIDQKGISIDLLTYGLEKTKSFGGKSFRYTQNIYTQWINMGIKTKEEAVAEERSYKDEVSQYREKKQQQKPLYSTQELGW